MKNKSILGFKELWASKVEKKISSKNYRKKFQFFQNRVLKMFRIVKKDARHFHHNLSMRKSKKPIIVIIIVSKHMKTLCFKFQPNRTINEEFNYFEEGERGGLGGPGVRGP